MSASIEKLAALLILLAAAYPSSMSATEFSYTYKGVNITYNVIDTSRKYVETKSADKSAENVEIPAKVTYGSTTYTVTKIGDNSFNSASLENITIPNTVTSIGEYAFENCYYIKSVTIPEGVKSIGSAAFLDSGLTEIKLPNSLTFIDGSAFKKCTELTSIVIPDNVTSFGENTFDGCWNLEYAIVGNKVTKIEDRAFLNCSSLKSVILGSSVKSVAEKAFNGCNALTKSAMPKSLFSSNFPNHPGTWYRYDSEGATVYDGCLWNADKSTLYFVPVTRTGHFEIPQSVTLIYTGAFAYCTGLTSVKINENEEYDSRWKPEGDQAITIDDKAFMNCTGLKSITIPNSVTKIGDSAFEGCTGLKDVVIGKWIKIIGTDAFKDCSGLKKCAMPNTTSSNLFSRVTCVKYPVDDVVIEDGFVWKGSYNREAIYYAPTTLFGKFDIPSTVKTIGDCAFEYCSGLTEVEMPRNLQSIGDYAFCGCSALTGITIPQNVTSIGGYAFYECDRLTSIEIPQGVTYINICTFYGCDNLRSVSLLGNVTTLQSSAFKYCENLTEFTIPETVTKIGNQTFYNCSKLTNITIPASVTTIGTGAFAVCKSLTNIELPNSVTSLGEQAFSNCSGLTSVTLPDSLPTILYATFMSCSNLQSISIPSSVTEIDSYAFEGCSGLNDVYCNWETPVEYTYSNVFDTSTYDNATLHVPAGTIPAYKNANFWKSFQKVFAAKVPITNIGLSSGEYVINEGDSLKLTPTITPDESDNRVLEWKSSNDEVATVDQEGMVKALSQGSAVITVSSTDGSEISATCDITVRKLVSDITLNETDATLNEGQTVQLTATVSPELADNKSLEWKSSDEAVATVDQEGLVKAIAQGTAVITVSSTDGSEISATCNITVRKLVSGITLNETSATLNEGQSVQLTATVSPELADNKTLAWTSSNDAVATVDQNGLVTAVAQGSAVITVKSTDGSEISATSNITVRKLVSDITLNETSATLNEGQSVQLTATVSPELADNKTLEWTSSNETVATVDQNGLVTAVAQGSAVITVKSTDGSEISATCNITVRKLVSDITLNETSATLNEGQTVQLTATVSPELADNKTLEWTSSNETVATVDQNGLVTAVAQGTAVITVKSTDGSEISATCNITVRKLVSDITLNETDATLNEGQTFQLIATVSPELANNKSLEWKSSDEAIATVDQEGLVKAIAQGTAVITVKSTDGSDISATCNITVRKLVSKIVLSESDVTMSTGESRQLTATVYPDEADDKSVDWKSSDESVATVDETGLVTAISNGNATITAIATDGSGISASCGISISTVTGIEEIAPDENDDVRIFNLSGILIYTGKYKDANLSPGIYIIVTWNDRYKHQIK